MNIRIVVTSISSCFLLWKREVGLGNKVTLRLTRLTPFCFAVTFASCVTLLKKTWRTHKQTFDSVVFVLVVWGLNSLAILVCLVCRQEIEDTSFEETQKENQKGKVLNFLLVLIFYFYCISSFAWHFKRHFMDGVDRLFRPLFVLTIQFKTNFSFVFLDTPFPSHFLWMMMTLF